MYFVDRNNIEETLKYIETLLQELDNNTFDSMLEKLALERLGHMVIEAIIDVGNMVIDGFIMRDPGSYEDIIDILVDEQVLPEDTSVRYKEIIHLRKMLVKEYLYVDDNKLKHTLVRNKEVLANFPSCIRTYMHNELDVANAFSND